MIGMVEKKKVIGISFGMIMMIGMEKGKDMEVELQEVELPAVSLVVEVGLPEVDGVVLEVEVVEVELVDLVLEVVDLEVELVDLVVEVVDLEMRWKKTQTGGGHSNPGEKNVGEKTNPSTRLSCGKTTDQCTATTLGLKTGNRALQNRR